MTNSILDRIYVDSWYSPADLAYKAVAIDENTGEEYYRGVAQDTLALYHIMQAGFESLQKEWQCQDPISNSELKYRRTIISSCGQLSVRESLS